MPAAISPTAASRCRICAVALGPYVGDVLEGEEEAARAVSSGSGAALTPSSMTRPSGRRNV